MTGAGAISELARPVARERRRLVQSVALAAGAAAAAIGLLATSGYLISRAAQRPPILTLMMAIVAVRAFGLTRAALRYGERLAAHDLALRQLARTRLRLYRALAPLAPSGLRGGSGELLSRFVADVEALQDVYPRIVIPALVALLVVLGASLAAWLMLPAAGETVLAALTLAVVALPWLSGAAAARAARRQAPARARLTGELVEGIDGASELALAGSSQAYVERLRASDGRLARIARSDALACAAATTTGGVLGGAGVLAVLAVAIPAVRAGHLSGVLLAALVFLALAAYDSILPLGAAARSLRQCAAAAARVREIAERTPAIAETAPAIAETPPGIAETARSGGAPRHAGGAADGLALEQVSFRYGAGEPWVLAGAQLRIARGEHVALVGPSGAGKSTLGELLVRFADPTSGRVTLDGADLRELPQHDLRAQVLLCAQDCHLFNTTVRENLLIGRRGATERELREALAVVELDEWLAALPDGLDTLVGQNGELLSGGQRRRLALARALLTRAPFLILDEPTAHLDAELAERLMDRLLAVCEDRAMLVITHDPTALASFDRVLQLRDAALIADAGRSPTLAAA
ncbi:MAG TPA: thiol reductant ABC exporter subunit CydC [Solirubrobacteraceae bacterium]|nr:thiol reductant ABC exporter subunit CydC [Solirubrobacteraceae bacterium]